MLLDGEGFILQVQWVFTRIRSGAAAVCTGGGFLARSASNGCKCGGEKPYGFWLLFISQQAAPQRPDGYVSKQLTQRRRLTFQLPVVDAPYLGGLATSNQLPGYRQDSRANQDTFYIQDDPSIREEVLDSKLGGSVPRVLRFFLRILRDNLVKTSD
jgi:hypothetical protein